MPQLVKGGKWVFGWTVVGSGREILIPPQAYAEYGFQAGEEVLFLAGSRTSGGFGIGRPERLAGSPVRLQSRTLGQGVIEAGGLVKIPAGIDLQPGARLLAARGSGLALGFLQRGRIYSEALQHPEIEVFEVGDLAIGPTHLR
ncbi:MAG: hypothetical protein AB1894_10740 [Chloroflexota bacterium]